MATQLTPFYAFSEALAEKTHNLGSDQLAIALTPAANPPALTDTQLSNLTQVSYTNLSGANPRFLSRTSSGQTSGAYTLIMADLTLTASGGSVGPFRYVVVYNDTATNDELIGYYDYGENYTIADGKSFILDFDAVNGMLQINPGA